ncbi:MAG TPA: diacylglycerol kinase family protein [Thermoanaerobaculia bacterium]|nr:diacylglycerol kinase family protein [Thermoanaerobaculia bacterium]
MKALFVINARSGPVRGRDLAALIRASCELEHDIVATERKEDLDAIVAEAQRNGFEAVIAVGGDGTVHEVAKRLIGNPIALGIVPTGSGNGFARHHGIPTKVVAAVRVLPTAKRVTIDTAEVNGMPFIGVMGIGYAAHIAHRFAALPRRGLRSYIRAALSAFRSYECEEYEINGGRHRAFLVEIANTAHWGNNFRIAPTASVFDGVLEVVIVDPLSWLDAPLFGARLRFGSVHRSRRVKTQRLVEVVIAGAKEMHLDGEPLEAQGELRIRVRPHSLHVLVPRDAKVI